MSGALVISDPFWANERDIRVGELSLGWTVNRAARLSCHLRARDVHALAFDAIKGRWVWTNGPCGPWGGYVEDDPVEIATGIMELNCSDMMGSLDFAITPRTYRQYSSSPGALIGRAIRDSGQDEPLWIDETTIDEDGRPVTVEWRGEQTGKVVRSLANGASGLLAVSVDTDGVISLDYRVEPIDMRDSILLVEGREVVAGSIRPSISQLVNDILGIANDRDWQRATGARAINARSVRDYGRRRVTRTYPGHTRASSIEPAARLDVARLSQPSGPVSLQLVDRHPIVGELRVAQLISLWSSSSNRIFDLTITGIAHDTVNRTVTVVGTVTEQE